MTKVTFQRGNQEFIDNLPILDGQLTYNIDNGMIYQDVVDRRVPLGTSVSLETRDVESLTIEPNIFYSFGERANLTITLSQSRPSILNEYMFQFKSPAGAPTNLMLPADIKWVQPLVIEANKTYQISIVDKIGVIVGV